MSGAPKRFASTPFTISYWGKPDISVGIVTRLRDAESGIRIPAEARGVSFLVNVHRDAGAHTTSYSEKTGDSLP
jgi:hypothetical protein